MRKLIAILVMLVLASVLYGSNEGKRIVIKGVTTGFTTESNRKLHDVTIRVYKFNKLITTFYSNSKGKFEFEIPKNSYITLVFEKDNFVSKRILFDTRSDNSDIQSIKPFDLKVMLIENIEGIDYEDLDFPITKIMFNEKMNDYSYAKKYTELMLKKQEEILLLIEQKILAAR